MIFLYKIIKICNKWLAFVSNHYCTIPACLSFTRVIPKVMSNVAQLATLQHQMIEYRLVGDANYCHIFE